MGRGWEAEVFIYTAACILSQQTEKANLSAPCLQTAQKLSLSPNFVCRCRRRLKIKFDQPVNITCAA